MDNNEIDYINYLIHIGKLEDGGIYSSMYLLTLINLDRFLHYDLLHYIGDGCYQFRIPVENKIRVPRWMITDIIYGK